MRHILESGDSGEVKNKSSYSQVAKQKMDDESSSEDDIKTLQLRNKTTKRRHILESGDAVEVANESSGLPVDSKVENQMKTPVKQKHGTTTD